MKLFTCIPFSHHVLRFVHTIYTEKFTESKKKKLVWFQYPILSRVILILFSLIVQWFVFRYDEICYLYMMSIATVYACNIARGAQWEVSIAASVESIFRPTTPSKIKVHSNEEQTSKLSLDNWISHWSLHKTCCSCSAVGAFRLSKSVNAYVFFQKKKLKTLFVPGKPMPTLYQHGSSEGSTSVVQSRCDQHWSPWNSKHAFVERCWESKSKRWCP